MPTITISSTGNLTEQEALASLQEMGFHGFADDGVGNVEELHWHDFDAIAYVISGEASAELADGTVISAGAGTMIRFPRGIVHKDVPGNTYRRVLGFSIPRSEMTEPINRPVDQLPA